MRARMLRIAAAAVAGLALQACVMVPVTKLRYAEECRTVVKQMTMEPVQLASIGGCSNEGCVTLVALAGVTAAASAVVSGSVAVVGNVVYWLERGGRCGLVSAPAAAATPGSAAPVVNEAP
jgi:hypothetical protein